MFGFFYRSKLRAGRPVNAVIPCGKVVPCKKLVKQLVSTKFGITNDFGMKRKEPLILDNTCTKDDELIAAKDTLAVLGGKWKIQLITTLNCGGALQFMEIQRIIDGIGPKMLSKELHDLELNHLVKRSVMDTKPVTVKYELTAHGRTLENIINQMRVWGLSHRKEVFGK